MGVQENEGTKKWRKKWGTKKWGLKKMRVKKN